MAFRTISPHFATRCLTSAINSSTEMTLPPAIASRLSNQLAPIPGYTVVNLHSAYRPIPHLEFFASVDNLLNRKYATWGILSDPTGIGTPGIPVDAVTNGPGVNNRFLSPAAPLELFGGLRVTF